MPGYDITQADLFRPGDAGAGPSNPGERGRDPLPLLTIPCGFLNRRNAPCRRFGNRPVTIDGEPFHHRGHWIVHCDPRCFMADVAEAGGGGEIGSVRAGAEKGRAG